MLGSLSIIRLHETCANETFKVALLFLIITFFTISKANKKHVSILYTNLRLSIFNFALYRVFFSVLFHFHESTHWYYFEYKSNFVNSLFTRMIIRKTEIKNCPMYYWLSFSITINTWPTSFHLLLCVSILKYYLYTYIFLYNLSSLNFILYLILYFMIIISWILMAQESVIVISIRLL